MTFWRKFNELGSPNLSEDQNWNQVFLEVLNEVSYKDGYGLILVKDKKDPNGRWFFQAECERLDSVTGDMGIGRGGKFYLSPHMVKGEIVQAVFGLFLKYEEHECREFFHWKDRAVFGPHIQIEALHEAAEHTTFRP